MHRLGHYEKFDAEAVLHELRSGGRSNGRVALWGRSMGAATALIGAYIKLSRRVRRLHAIGATPILFCAQAMMCAARLDPLVCCVLADSSFASLPMLVHDLLDEKVGAVLVDAAMGVVSRSVAYRAGFKISDVRVDAVAPVCPIMLVHGSEDTFIGLKHSQALQRAFQKTATLRVDEGGKHDSRRPDDVLVDCAAFLLDKLVGEPAGVPELRAALTLTRGLGRPPFASSTNFTSGADANRQKAVRATLTRGGAVSC
jgi:pimeloyl-ACP methyl ester carboxylesterase